MGQKYRRSGAAQRHISAWGEGKEREKLESKRPFFLLIFRDFSSERSRLADDHASGRAGGAGRRGALAELGGGRAGG